MDFNQFSLAMGGLCVAYNVQATTERLAVYFNGLASISNDAMNFAVTEIIKTRPKFPTVAEIREMANAYRAPVKAIPYKPPEGQTDYGREAAALIAFWSEEKDNGNTVPVRDRLKAMARLADKHQRVDLANIVMEEWEKLSGE